MPAIYEQWGVKFLYPENWQLTDEQVEDWPKSVTVQAPGGAFLTLNIYPPDVDLQGLTREAVDAMRELYEDIEVRELEAGYDGADYGYDIDFYCLDLIVTAQIRGRYFPERTLLWICQAENRDFEDCEPVFRAILMQVLGKLPSPPSGE